MSLNPGQMLSHYRLVKQIGEGGMGVVHLAHDTRLQRDVALKVLPAGLLSDETVRRRFRREAQALSKLNHPNVATVHDFDTQDGVDFLVMEYIRGVTLNDKLSAGPLPEETVVQLGTQLAEGLAAAHDEGVMHRDVKPGNLRVTPDGRLKILDFGLAKLLQPADPSPAATTMTQTQGIVGTPMYMSPEQLRDEEVDARTDIFASGIVLYEMATGRRPFEAKSVMALVADIQHKSPTPPKQVNPSISPRLEEVILKCLEKEPDSRYSSARDLLADLEQLRAPVSLTEAWRHLAPTRRWLLAGGAALAGLLVLGLLNVGGWRAKLLGGAGRGPITSIAVLPLENLSGDPEQDYLAAGIHEALITDLAKLGGFKRVIARSSAMRYQDTDKPLSEIARELNVDAVITGSVLRAGDRVRVTAQLTSAATGETLWANRYERELRDVLSLQNEIVAAITREINLQLTPEETTLLASARPVNPEAYEAYLKGRFHWYRLTPQDVEAALQYFQLALQKDPDYALAYTGIAEVWSNGAIFGVPPREAIPKAKAAALKAIQLDSMLAEAHDLLARVRTWGEWDWAGAESEFQRAIELNPGYPDARVFYSMFLTALGRPEEARVQIERALELDPLNFFFEWAFGWHLLRQRRYDDGIVQLRRSLRKEPNFLLAHLHLWGAFHERRMYEEALAEAKAFFAAVGVPDAAEALARGYAQAGYPTAMSLAAETLAARSNLAYVPPEWIAELYARAGDEERALEWLEKAYQDRNIAMVFLSVNPTWDSLRDDPRFQDLVRRMNFPE